MEALDRKSVDAIMARRDRILSHWRDRIYRCYPPETARVFRATSDPFRNPVGAAVTKTTEDVLEHLLAGATKDQLSKSLDPLVRLGAVQDIDPGRAVGFLFELKGVMRAELKDCAPDAVDIEEMERRLDESCLVAFDIYTACREKIMEIRINEVRNRFYKVLERTDDTVELPVRPGNPQYHNGSIQRGRL